MRGKGEEKNLHDHFTPIISETGFLHFFIFTCCGCEVQSYAPLVQEHQPLREHQPHPEEKEVCEAWMWDLLLICFTTFNSWIILCTTEKRWMKVDLGSNSSSLSLWTIKTWITLEGKSREGKVRTFDSMSFYKAETVMSKVNFKIQALSWTHHLHTHSVSLDARQARSSWESTSSLWCNGRDNSGSLHTTKYV